MDPLPFPVLALSGQAEFKYWVEFGVLVLVLLAFDLFVAHRKAHVIPFKEALGWSIFWIGIALAFNGWVFYEFGETSGLQFLTAYVMEKALSVDNLFIFIVLFNFFKVPQEYRHRVLFFGIAGALVMRGIFIFLGLEFLERFKPSFYIFGAILLFTAWKLMRSGNAHFDPEKSLFYRIGNRVLPLAGRYEGGKFLVKEDGRTKGTTLLLVLFIVEGTDVVFALDSVPAVIAISQDRFIVYTSNVFAIMGLRALFFLVAGVLESVPGLQAGLSLVLAFVGVKMCLTPTGFHVHPAISLAVVVGILFGSWAIASLMRRAERKREKEAAGK